MIGLCLRQPLNIMLDGHAFPTTKKCAMSLITFIALHAVVLHSAAGYERPPQIEVSTEQDVLDAVQRYEDVWVTLTRLCDEDESMCLNNCGKRSMPLIDRQFIDKSSISTNQVSCSCDAMCMIYNDCCHDFQEGCPGEMRKYHQSPLKNAKAVCVGFHIFLAYDNGTDATGMGNPFESGKMHSLKDVSDSLIARGPAVTDTLTGNQFISKADLDLLLPDQDFTSVNRLANWTPTLKSRRRKELSYLIDLMESPSKSFADNLDLIFEPPHKDARNCLTKVTLHCPRLTPDFVVRNLTLACKTIANNAMLFQNDSAFFEWDWYNASEIKTTSITLGPRTKYGSFTGSTLFPTSEYLISDAPQQVDPYCTSSFRIDTDKTPFAFSYLLDLQTEGQTSLTAYTGLISWQSISCKSPKISSQEEIDKKEIATDISDIEKESCRVEVRCKDIYTLTNGACDLPFVLMLDITAAASTDQEEFRLGVEKFIKHSEILSHQSMYLWQDPISCISQRSGGLVYYGLYYILRHSVQVSLNNRLPLMEQLGKALTKLAQENSTVSDIFEETKLCAIFTNGNESSYGKTLLREKGRDKDYLINTYVNSGAPRNTTVVTHECDISPWPWTDNIFIDPFVTCETITPVEVVLTPNREIGEKKRNSVSNMFLSYWAPIAWSVAVLTSA